MTLTSSYYKTFKLAGLDFEVLDVRCSSKEEYRTLIHDISSNSRIRRIAFAYRVPGKKYHAYRIGLVGDRIFSIYGLLDDSDAICLGTKYYEGIEIWDFVVPREDLLTSLCREFLRMGSILGVEIKKIDLHELEGLLFPYHHTGLTGKELETIKRALHMGYFEWPRHITLQDLANEFRISKSTINEYMRKGMKKILTSYLCTRW